MNDLSKVNALIQLGMKFVVIALLLLSGAALIFGILLFQQRETLKGRTQKLETAVLQVAATIEAGDATEEKLALSEDQLKTYKQKPGGPATMDAPLNQLVTAAQDQLARLSGTRTVLAETRVILAKTEADLADTRAELASAKDEIVQLNETVAAQDLELEEKEASIKSLENEKSMLYAQVEEFEALVDDLESHNRELVDQTLELQAKLKTLESAQIGDKQALPKGQHGAVLYVSPDWNFLIVGIAAESQKSIAPNLELLIQRADRLVGKVRIAAIVDNMAVAEIINDWEQFPPQKGDYAIY